MLSLLPSLYTYEVDDSIFDLGSAPNPVGTATQVTYSYSGLVQALLVMLALPLPSRETRPRCVPMCDDV